MQNVECRIKNVWKKLRLSYFLSSETSTMKYMKKLKGVKLPELHDLHGEKYLSFSYNETRQRRVDRSFVSAFCILNSAFPSVALCSSATLPGDNNFVYVGGK